MEILAPDGTHPKNYFLKNNGLDRILYDLNFSVLQKYRCFANCKNCYTKDFWISSTQIKKFAPSRIAEQTAAHWFEVFGYFEMVSIIDDLKFIKDEFPHLWQFYVVNQNRFYLSSLNDNAVIRHFDLLTEEFFPLGIHEICLSEEFLVRQSVSNIMDKIDKIHKRVPVRKIVFYRHLSPNGENEKQLHSWCSVRQVSFEVNDSVLESLSQSFASRSQSLFLMYDLFYIALKAATTEAGTSYSRLYDFEPRTFLADTLSTRKNNLPSAGGEKVNPYYAYLYQHLKVHKDYNFIPVPVLPPFTKYYKALVSKGLAVETKYGLLVKANEDLGEIKPLIEFKDKE
ncbi:MAG: hypothetical protein B7Y39_11965 [Bdellovibrio sp. 28-41-41]|nr:MAG: hypothetical protein B7Y39_11965 [Bdellovibrio sp. 28-41-41]